MASDPYDGMMSTIPYTHVALHTSKDPQQLTCIAVIARDAFPGHCSVSASHYIWMSVMQVVLHKPDAGRQSIYLCEL